MTGFVKRYEYTAGLIDGDGWPDLSDDGVSDLKADSVARGKEHYFRVLDDPAAAIPCDERGGVIVSDVLRAYSRKFNESMDF